jgi:hypothetical protein
MSNKEFTDIPTSLPVKLGLIEGYVKEDMRIMNRQSGKIKIRGPPTTTNDSLLFNESAP